MKMRGSDKFQLETFKSTRHFNVIYLSNKAKMKYANKWSTNDMFQIQFQQH